MNTDRISKNLKFKIDDLYMSTTVEEPIVLSTESSSLIRNLHYHVMYELFFVDENPLTLYTAEGITEFKNCLVCIPPFCKHRSLRKSGQRILFTFDKTKKHNSEFSRFMDTFFSKQNPFEIEINDSLSFFCRELRKLFHSDASLVDEIAVSMLKLIFYNIFSNNAGLNGYETKKDTFSTNESYLVIIDDIISAFRRDISLQTVADALHLSTKHTSRIIQKNYKKTLSELVTEKRLSVAAELLIRSDKTVLEIIEYVNFSSERYFYSQFKKAFGCTPLKYKKMNRLSDSM